MTIEQPHGIVQKSIHLQIKHLVLSAVPPGRATLAADRPHIYKEIEFTLTQQDYQHTACLSRGPLI